MIDIDNELILKLGEFKDTFGDIVPLRELPSNIKREDLIKAIDDSIKENTNLLPTLFGYKNLEENKNILM